MNYTLTMLNGLDDPLNMHFSCDETWILQADIMFIIINLLMGVATVWFARRLKTQQLFHTTFKLFIASLLVSWSPLQIFDHDPQLDMKL